MPSSPPASPTPAPTPSYPLVARASNTVRNKNILMLLMCLGFFIAFAYDAFLRWPAINDNAVAHLNKMVQAGTFPHDPAHFEAWKQALAAWPGWNKATPDQRHAMDAIASALMTVPGAVDEWKKPFDIELQRWIVYGLAAAVLAAVWWLVHCQQRRATADENTVSPSPGLIIPWNKITVVDNTRWKKSGIVEITYLDDAGNAHNAKFDDYETDREPLLEILDLLAEKAQTAEFIPKEEPAKQNP